MRAAKIGGPGLVGTLILMWIGCAGASAGKREPHHMECASDTDCRTGFCDRGHCETLTEWSAHGGECPLASGDKASEPYPFCHGYPCVDGRCRACRSNADCHAYYGASECVDIGGVHAQPGGVCWPMGADRWDHDNVPGITEVCAHDPADAPGQKRLAARQACLRDCDCLSTFCDRGACADKADLGAWNYGKGRCAPGPPHAPIDNTLTLPVWDICAGYLCVEGRCRSCQSDAECQEGSSEYKCLPLYGLPGKRCGRPSEAELGPAPNRMGPPPTPRAAPRPKGR